MVFRWSGLSPNHSKTGPFKIRSSKSLVFKWSDSGSPLKFGIQIMGICSLFRWFDIQKPGTIIVRHSDPHLVYGPQFRWYGHLNSPLNNERVKIAFKIYLSTSNGKFKRFSTIAGRVDLLSICQRQGVVASHLLAGPEIRKMLGHCLVFEMAAMPFPCDGILLCLCEYAYA